MPKTIGVDKKWHQGEIGLLFSLILIAAEKYQPHRVNLIDKNISSEKIALDK